MIYLDNAATTLYKPNEVYLRSNEVFRLFSANSGRSGHKAALKAAEIVMQTRAAAAEFLGIYRKHRFYLWLHRCFKYRHQRAFLSGRSYHNHGL